MATIDLAGISLDLWEGGDGTAVAVPARRRRVPRRSSVPRLAWQRIAGSPRRRIPVSACHRCRNGSTDRRTSRIFTSICWIASVTGPIDLIACSLGGWIGAELASMVPERFRRLIFVGTGRRETWLARHAGHSRYLRPARRDDRETAVSRTGTVSRRSGEDDRPGTRDHAAQSRDDRAADLGTLHAQSETAASVAPRHQSRRCSCAASTTD